MTTIEQILPRTHDRAPLTTRRRSREAAVDLRNELERRLDGEVRFDTGSRALYATDLSIYRHVPIGVVVPRSDEDVIATVAACSARKVPILARGCGTSLSGQCCNVAVVIDFSKYMNRILALDPDGRLAKVQPGIVNDDLRHAAARFGLTFAPDPATHRYCTLGGNIGNNSCGAHTFWGGKTVDNVEALDVLTYDGLRMRVGATSADDLDLIGRAGGRRAEIYSKLKALADRYGDEIRRRYPKIPRRVSGYNLDDLLPENGFHVARALVGSESTCALTLSATVRLLPSPPARALLIIGYEDLAEAADDVPAIRELGATALEGFQRHVVSNLEHKGKPHAGAKLLPEGDAWLMVEFGGEEQAEANANAERASRRLQHDSRATGMRVIESADDQSAIWELRESGVGASHIPGEEEAWPSWEDAAVPPERLGSYLREFKKLNERYGYRYTLFGHFGDGCIHARMTFGLKTAQGVANFRSYMEEAADLCLAYGGSLSGEHGDGQAKGELLPRMFGQEIIQAFREFKSIWDPHWRMNPGKIVDARPLDADLRLGPDFRPRPVATHFKFPEDHGSFAKATERCFGVGKCRSLDGQVMCPSFQATREEMHSTRGRAHLLFEMMRGDPLDRGWREKSVHEALDLCLQCKGCKHDCPVSVDMATYKAEFLAHYYAGRLRPAAAYSMGLVFAWARLAACAPGLANFVLEAPILGPALRRVAGFAPQRDPPTFAPQTFQDWFLRRERRQDSAGRPEVVLWPDTFNNYFLPGTAKAAVEVLEAAGYRVLVPQQRLCCGRPLYDYGMLEAAKKKLRQVINAVRPAIRAGVPIIGLEPSCVSVFRDELVNLLPEDEDAQRLAKSTKLLSEFLVQDSSWEPPPLRRKALVHMHCHHRSVLDGEAQEKLFAAMGLDVHSPKAGCCGQAGSFGYEKDHYDISIKIAEHALLPALRKTPRDVLVVADGFSCRDQIRHTTDRWAIHPAEVLALAIRHHDDLPAERASALYREPAARVSRKVVVGAGAAVLGGILLSLAFRR
ncbi:MAG TPA: FAD-linked oxidase C-terminal domain-containing protein [Xanthobacteraceae bacterium]|jgi:FAD/FMN-containing dehydrogenase/Fe-S oxidoreductase